MKLANNKILITGGATGIGLGLTERFISENNTVIICGRRETALKEVAEKFPSVITKVCDLEGEEGRNELYEWVAANHSDLNVLVNNAGVQNWMNVSDDDFYERAKTEVDINILAPIHLTKLFLSIPSLNTIINVSSGLAFTPFSKVPVYCGTKAFTRSFTISLRHQLKDKNIEVIELIPPAINTALGGQVVHKGLPEVSDFVASIFEQLKEGKTELTFGSSETRAKANNETISEYLKLLNP
ncbi:SDR family NAD(P)-dependent oxidoreductase [Flavobacterium cupreum]|uniref:Oxidoreductase n=2 Tax=Flavobacterium TaxID=237 RepID=A0A4Y7UEA4_9FLAO|nr:MULTISPECIES: SDR family NAD(P)-dependent oxidoreductase [Flavobacterium]RUT67924.1 SDR family NAD(P)-dependent oxidoreductase [Flavobacterium cupreum]TCN59473.1 putative oxidoreductase [Flavobacterium circumlabens]TEB44775.1 SDR family NAD(P)-dependent oxidoreductase [Flavobacterium circumlabens]